jgi:hypothetical protein
VSDEDIDMKDSGHHDTYADYRRTMVQLHKIAMVAVADGKMGGGFPARLNSIFVRLHEYLEELKLPAGTSADKYLGEVFKGMSYMPDLLELKPADRDNWPNTARWQKRIALATRCIGELGRVPDGFAEAIWRFANKHVTAMTQLIKANPIDSSWPNNHPKIINWAISWADRIQKDIRSGPPDPAQLMGKYMKLCTAANIVRYIYSLYVKES